MKNLKPCPFCGARVSVEEEGPIGGYVVRCGNCSSQTPIYLRADLAIGAWNRRAERTCTNVWDKEPEPKCDNGFMCSLCGYSVSDGEDWRVFTNEHGRYYDGDCAPWRYCPGCGAKVVKR